MNRLWVQLTLAISAIILVAVGAIGILINRTTNVEFRRYVTHSGMQSSGSAIDQLVAFYEEHGGWEGVETLLADKFFTGTSVGGLLPEPGSNSAQVLGPEVGASGPPGAGRVTFTAAPLEAQLADATGRVVYDTENKAVGKRLTRADKQNALSLTNSTNGQVIGYLVLSIPGPPDKMGGLERQFLERMRTVLIVGGVLAVAAGFLAGALLSRNLTAPLRRLAAATRAVGRGQLGHQVKVEGSAEMAEVGRSFNEMSAALADAETQRQNMVADVAHELRTPLTVLQGNLRALLDGVYTLDRIEISHLYDETRLLSRIVDDLRELAQADAGQLRLNVQPVDLSRVIHDTLDTFVLAAEAQQVSISSQLGGTMPTVRADPDRVAQILRNLLLNALRHTPACGSITVTATPANGMVEVAVSDTGEGIAPDDLRHVFERFWRADPSRSRDDRMSGGTGLGLSIAQSLVQAQGGRIWAESALGEGSLFRFTLPVA